MGRSILPLVIFYSDYQPGRWPGILCTVVGFVLCHYCDTSIAVGHDSMGRIPSKGWDSCHGES